MIAEQSRNVAVIIAARNAETTIAPAVSSALAQTQTAEVIVVDDASSDRTASAAESAGDGTNRLRIIRLETQAGPSRARNLAIDASTAPFIALLDGDDLFLPGRFGWLLSDDGWDFVADNIVMFRAGSKTAEEILAATPQHVAAARAALTLQSFVEGNISGPEGRRELGFLKPVMRRDFLDRAGLRYNEGIRFAEDYDLYCRALIAGARFKVDLRVGYGALVHANSLSSTHSTRDLAILLDVDDRLLALTGIEDGARAALTRHRRQTISKYRYRELLDRRRADGRIAALLDLLASPAQIPDTLRHLARDKLRPFLAGVKGQPFNEPTLLLPQGSRIVPRLETPENSGA